MTERDALRKAIVEEMGYDPEIRFAERDIEAAGIVDDDDSFSLSIMVAKAGEILLTKKELEKALKAIKELEHGSEN